MQLNDMICLKYSMWNAKCIPFHIPISERIAIEHHQLNTLVDKNIIVDIFDKEVFKIKLNVAFNLVIKCKEAA